jgi:hypothetical protein
LIQWEHVLDLCVECSVRDERRDLIERPAVGLDAMWPTPPPLRVL